MPEPRYAVADTAQQVVGGVLLAGSFVDPSGGSVGATVSVVGAATADGLF